MNDDRSLKGWSDIILGKPKKSAHFWYHGDAPSKDRLVRLYQNQKGTYTVEVEGMPALTQTVTDEDKALAVFDGFWQMAWKDWGPSEIDWSNW